MEKVIIFGEGGIQELAYFFLQRDERYDVIGFTADKKYITEETYLGLPMVPFEDVEFLFPPSEYKMFIPLGYRKNNHLREEKCIQAKKKGYSFITYISPNATYYGTPIGENCFIFDNCVIEPFTTIGDSVIMWSGSVLAHYASLGNYCYLAANVTVAGGAKIGDYTFIGVNATIKHLITIGQENIIGAGAVILKSTDDKDVYAAARSVLLDKRSDEVYL